MTRTTKQSVATGLAVLAGSAAIGMAVLVAAKLAQAASNGLVAVEIKLPKATVIGTPKELPKDILLLLDPPVPQGQDRPPLMAPKGTRNLALNRSVSSSDKEPIIGKLDMVTDGDKEGVNGSVLELGPGVQWVQIDLGQRCEIWGVLMWHDHSRPGVYKDVSVMVSDDADFVTDSRIVFNNDHDNTAGFGIGKNLMFAETYKGKLIETKQVKARFVRLYSKGNTNDDQNHYTEVEVYGVPVP
jgi:hypothetical protein